VTEGQPTWTSDDPQASGDLEQVFEVSGCMRCAPNLMRHACAILNWRLKLSAPRLLCTLRHLPSAPRLCLGAIFTNFSHLLTTMTLPCFHFVLECK